MSFALPLVQGNISVTYLYNEIARDLRKDYLWALLGFHSFMGCSTVYVFAGKGEKNAWNTWKWLLYQQLNFYQSLT